LRALLGPPFPRTRESYEGLDACIGHLHKYEIFARVADRIVPELPKDYEELEKYAASRNIHSQEFGALSEAMICELYASLDGLRQFLCALYPKVQGMQNKSNEKLFRKAKDRAYSADFPEPLRIALAEAYDEWFLKLRILRGEITHGTIGHCHVNQDKQTVTYYNEGLGSNGNVFVLEDVVSVVKSYHGKIQSFIAKISEYFINQLSPIERMYPCGTYLGLMYIRVVAPSPRLTFNDGHCASWNWFEKEGQHFCPLAKTCGAYTRKWPGGDETALKL
jgi:hypothetical protein